VVLFVTGHLLSGTVMAQELTLPRPEIVTDRPDQTESSSLVPVGALQVETGFMVEGDRSGSYRESDYTYNTTLIKYGINENFEFRLIQEYLGNKGELANETIRYRGFSPVSIGAKIRIADEGKYTPQVAFLGHITLPTGSEKYNPSYICSDFRFSMEYDFTDRVSLGVNLGAQGDGESPVTTGIYTLEVGYSLLNKLSLFAELYGFVSEKTKADQDHRFNGGISYLITDVLQYDMSAGIGLSESSTDYFVSTGLSFRVFK